MSDKDREILEQTCFAMWLGGLFVAFVVSGYWALNFNLQHFNF